MVALQSSAHRLDRSFLRCPCLLRIQSKLPNDRPGLIGRTDAVDYTASIFSSDPMLFADTIRQRGNQYLDHLRQGQPPVLTFDYEVLLDGRKMDPPTNYYLASDPGQAVSIRLGVADFKEKRRNASLVSGSVAPKRPLIIIDPQGRSRSRNRGLQTGFGNWNGPGPGISGVCDSFQHLAHRRPDP
jgi:hypothetical protein